MARRVSAKIICAALIVETCAMVALAQENGPPVSSGANNGRRLDASATIEHDNEPLARGAPELAFSEPSGGGARGEAHQLYCAECLQSCGSTSGRAQYCANNSAHHLEHNHTRLELECRCRAVYDSRHRSVRCKNMSRAEARSLNADGKPQVATRAVAGSRAERTTRR